MNDDLRKIFRARFIAVGRAPYLATAMWALTPVEAKQCPTMAVDIKWRLYYSPAWLQEISDIECAAVLVHEVWHLLRRHAERRGEREPVVWNIATDAEINDDLHKDGWTLPEGAVYPPHGQEGKTAEEYYQYEQQHGRQQQRPRCGSGATGVPEPWELRDEDGQDDGETPSVSAIEAEVVRRETASRIREAERAEGNIPSGIVRWAEYILGPSVVDWRKELAALLRRHVGRQSGAMDYTYSRASRRHPVRLGAPIIPALYAPVPPPIAVVVDTSGSVKDLDLQQALSEIAEIIRVVTKIRSAVSVIACDAQAYRPVLIRREQDLKKIVLCGGGGTDMGEGIAAALRLRPKPSLVIVITDGYTPWPEKRPPADVIVAMLTKESIPDTPKWAHLVKVTV